MRKKNIFRLSILMVILLTIYSCRNDYLPDRNDSYGDNNKFQLTSKTISLSESKHRNKLLPELEKAESEIRKVQKDYSGKSLQHGNEVSIDTDHVIYIENGPNYHTYTFNIIRENTDADAPVENLLLSLLPDGSYREFLITYHFTEQEKQNIREGNTISMQGKSEIVELAKGSFGNPLGKESCGYETVDVYIPCGTGEHHAGNVDSWSGCKWQKEGFAGPKHYSLVAYVCTGSPDDPGTSSPGTGSGGGGGSGSSGGGVNNNPPCEVHPPLTPKPGLTDENGCPIGNPTQPNLSDNRTPCKKIKAKFDDIKFKEKLAAIDKPEVFAYDHEMGFASAYPVNTTVTGTQYQPMENSLGTHNVRLPDGNQYFGYMHSHNNKSNGGTPIKIFSPADVITFLTSCVRNADEHGSIGDAYCMVITSEGNYMLQYSGTGDYSIGPNQVNNWKKWYKDNYEELARADELTQLNIEKTFVKFLAESVNIMGLEVYQVEKITGKASKLNTDGTKTPCP